MALDEDLVTVERPTRCLGATRSAFVSEALRAALARVENIEGRHRDGYLRKLVRGGEFSVWEAEQPWLD